MQIDKTWLAAVLLSVGLAACNSGGSDMADSGNAEAARASANVMGLLNYSAQLIASPATQAEAAEPVAVDGIVPPTTETEEPARVA